MQKIVSRLFFSFIDLVRRIIILKTKIFFRRSEQQEDRAICRKHKGEWQELTPAERKKYRHEEATYTLFKNISPQFAEHPEYYLSNYRYARDVLSRLSPPCHRVDGLPFDTIFNDKNYSEKFFPEIPFPRVILRCIEGFFFVNDRQISREEALHILEGYSDVVFKQALDAQHGSGIRPASGSEIAEVFAEFGQNFVVQELIRQHEFLASFNTSSVNVIRIMTVFWKGHVYAIENKLRIGAPGSFCDHTGFGGKNPLEIHLDENGNLTGSAYDYIDGVLYPTIFGKSITGTVPAFREMTEMALRGQMRYPSYGILGWDFTIDSDGRPLCIEVNSKFPGVKYGQSAYGPMFLHKTVDGNPLLDEILREPIPYSKLKLYLGAKPNE